MRGKDKVKHGGDLKKDILERVNGEWRDARRWWIEVWVFGGEFGRSNGNIT